jgi:DNA-binding PadR family transcriptional regulator
MHGYELMKRLEERSEGVYRALDGKRVYKLTEAGRGELKEHDETVRQIWRRARRWEDWRRPEPRLRGDPGPGRTLVKAAFRAVAGEQATQRIERVREILLRAPRDLEELGGRGS